MSPSTTRTTVTRHFVRSLIDGVAVDVGVAVGVSVGDAVAVGVGEAVAVGVAVVVGVAVGVGEAVGVTVGEGVGVSVAAVVVVASSLVEMPPALEPVVTTTVFACPPDAASSTGDPSVPVVRSGVAVSGPVVAQPEKTIRSNTATQMRRSMWSVTFRDGVRRYNGFPADSDVERTSVSSSENGDAGFENRTTVVRSLTP